MSEPASCGRRGHTHTPQSTKSKTCVTRLAGVFFCFDGGFLLGKLVAKALKAVFFSSRFKKKARTPHLDGLGCDFPMIFL